MLGTNILSRRDCPAMALKFENMRMVVVEQGGTAEAVLDAVNETIDSMTRIVVIFFFFGRLDSWGELAEEQWNNNYNFIDSREKDLRCFTSRFVPSRRASRNLGRDIIILDRTSALAFYRQFRHP